MEKTTEIVLKDEDHNTSRNQFSLSSLLLITASVAMLLGYARWLGAESLQQAIVFATFSAMIGIGFGWLAGNWQDSLFWSLLMTLLTYLAVAGGRLPNIAVVYGWGVIGSICGSASVLRVPKNQLLASMLLGAVSCLTMIMMISSFRFPLTGLVLFDVGSAAILGSMLHPLIRFLQWFEKRSEQPRLLLACWLTISVLTGNLLVPILGGVDR